MRVLVTGGAGFIGSALVRQLVVEDGFEVLNLDALTYAGNPASMGGVEGQRNYRFLHADICDQDAVRAAFADFHPDVVMHLAAESHVDRSIDGAARFIETNVVGTLVMLEAARHYWSSLDPGEQRRFRFVHISTDEVFGSLGPVGEFREDSPYDPSSPYSASKASSDHLVRAWHRTYGLPAVISNCSNNYGPRQFPEKLIPLTILNAMEGKPLPVYGRGENVRDWLYVDDHARALRRIAAQGRPGETYNVGGRSEQRNIDVVRKICQTIDAIAPAERSRCELVEFVSDRPGHDARYAIDPSKIERELGWRAQESFDSGIEKTVRWYLDNGWWWQPLRSGYGGERLGLSAIRS